jgi:hypothetical protein
MFLEKQLDQKSIENLLQSFLENPGYLRKSGWLRSMEESRAVDVDGDPILWITYPALDFLAGRVSPEMVVFEYGSGNSTFWWSRRVSKLVSCEHDKEWYASFRSEIPGNTTYLLRRAKGGSTDYAMEISKYEDMFDILVIDGRDRVNCVKNGLGSLHHDGVIVWDNSDRAEYQEGFDILKENGFKSLYFWGMGALATRRYCTSIFYRRENCLGI